MYRLGDIVLMCHHFLVVAIQFLFTILVCYQVDSLMKKKIIK